jgi:hypothetical protein
MIEYAFARNLQSLIGPSEIVGVKLPEWGIQNEIKDVGYDAEFVISDSEPFSLRSLASDVNSYKCAKIVSKGFFQDVELLPPQSLVRDSIFPLSDVGDDRSFGEEFLVINIRAGDILRGVAWYPIVPVEFYKYLVEKTCLRPVFVGQIDSGLYGSQLREAFPNAEFISTGVPLRDFSILRRSKNICIAVSTFSWLAAWISNASNVFFPVLGFLHPTLAICYGAEVSQANLVLTEDTRVRFYLFPLTFGLPELEMLKYYAKVGVCWREIPAKQICAIRERSPLLKPHQRQTVVDERYYSHRYIEAGWEIAEGWYQTPAHHFAEIGYLRGYSPSPPLYKPKNQNIALGKKAKQSSLSRWSLGSTIESDAGGAIDGARNKECGFHTDFSDEPWWQVDLGDQFLIECISVFNRRGNAAVRARALPMRIDVSLDEIDFVRICTITDHKEFLSETSGHTPVQIVPDEPIKARYIRISVGRRSCLNLSQIEIYGSKLEPNFL